jgi:hypothetical protein
VFAQTVTTSVATCGCFMQVLGSPSQHRFCGKGCSNPNCPAADSACPGTNFGTRVASQVRWGESVTLGDPFAQSGMGFTGESTKKVSFGREFYVGRLTHFNHPIIGPASGVHLNIRLDFPDFPQPISKDFKFRLNIDETTNKASAHPGGVCPYPSTVDCSDRITFDFKGFDLDSKFKIGAIEYTLALTGFKESPDSTSLPATDFISNEQRENNAFLFAKIVAACPDSCQMGAQIEYVRDTDGTLKCVCKCPPTASCQAPLKLQADCSCGCDTVACNGYKGDPANQCKCQCPVSGPPGGCPSPTTEWDPVACKCGCPTTACGTGQLINAALCSCSCASVNCPAGATPDPNNGCKCQCRLGECGPQLKRNDAACRCECDQSKNPCGPGFSWEPDPADPLNKCRCVCGGGNQCGAGCANAGTKPECQDDGVCCKQCRFVTDKCDDKNKCTANDKCQEGGKCTGETACPQPPDSCTYYECNPSVGKCEPKQMPDASRCGFAGQPNDTWDLCSFHCVNGQCTGKQRPDCGETEADKDPYSCIGKFCNKQTGRCDTGPQVGKQCIDKNPCTIDDVCKTDGVCAGKQKVCTDQKVCHTFKCNPLVGECEPTVVSHGTPCAAPPDDKCVTAGTCAGGVCLYGRKCPPLTEPDVFCNVTSCNPATGVCEKKPRAEGSKCIRASGLVRTADMCGDNFTCNRNGFCHPEKPNKETANLTLCSGIVAQTQGSQAKTGAIIGAVAAVGLCIAMVVAFALLFLFVSKQALTDPSTWGITPDTGLSNNPLYNEREGGGYNPLYKN